MRMAQRNPNLDWGWCLRYFLSKWIPCRFTSVAFWLLLVQVSDPKPLLIQFSKLSPKWRLLNNINVQKIIFVVVVVFNLITFLPSFRQSVSRNLRWEPCSCWSQTWLNFVLDKAYIHHLKNLPHSTYGGWQETRQLWYKMPTCRNLWSWGNWQWFWDRIKYIFFTKWFIYD